MRRDLVLAALLLPLTGCYIPPSGSSDYVQTGYPPGYSDAQPGYPPPGYPSPGYQPPPGVYYPDDNTYPGYSYNGGDPTMLVEGATVPLILYGGGWGYWDSRHSWHHAPDGISRRLDEQRRSGGGFYRNGGGRPPPDNRPFFGGGDPNRGQRFRANEQPRPGPPGGPSFRPNEQPRSGPPGGQFFHPNEQARPVAMPAAPPRPAPPPAPAAPPPSPQQRDHIGRQ